MHQLAWVRLMVARHPSIYWMTIAVVAGAVGLSAAKAIAGVEAARKSWGQQATVWVATVAIEPGQPIAVEAREVPEAVVPIGAVSHSPVGAAARQRIGPGEIVTTSDVTATGAVGLIPDGWVAFAVPASAGRFATGNHVDVYSADQLVAAGVVVADGDSDVMVAIPATAAPTMAAGLLADAVTLGLTPGP